MKRRWIRVNWEETNQTFSIYWMEGDECVAEEGFIDPKVSGEPLHEKDVRMTMMSQKIDLAEVDQTLEEVRAWLTEEKDPRVFNCRLAKLRWLMQWGFLTAAEAVDMWELTKPTDSRDPV